MDFTDLITHAVGLCASTIAFLLWLPQARLTWQLRHEPTKLAGISLGTQWLVILNATLWFAYGWLESAFWIAAPGFINLPLASATILMVYRARSRPPPPKCPVCREGKEHGLFVTAPPGWGTIKECDGNPPPWTVIYTSAEELSALRAQRSRSETGQQPRGRSRGSLSSGRSH